MGRPLDFAPMASNSSHRRNLPPRFPWWAEVPLFLGVLLFLAAVYFLVMNSSIDGGAQANGESTNSADALYFGLHGVLIVAAASLGTLLGVWLRRSAFAVATLAATWLVSVMLVAQVATFHLACEGTNDIIRHWQCEQDPGG
jgi:hypothetical protein